MIIAVLSYMYIFEIIISTITDYLYIIYQNISNLSNGFAMPESSTVVNSVSFLDKDVQKTDTLGNNPNLFAL